MGRVIQDSVNGDFPPLVGLREKGSFIKGKVLAIGETAGKNPVLTLAVIDLADNATTTRSTSKGIYEEVEVSVGDSVQVVGIAKQVREAIPQLNVGEIVTIKFIEKKKIPNGKTKNVFHIEVD